MKEMLTNNKGFTVLEMLVVIVVIGIMVTMALAMSSESREQAKISSAQNQLRSLQTSMEMLFNETGLYPHKEVSLCPPVNAVGNEIDLSLASAGLVDTDGTFTGWDGPYIRGAVDPWGTPFFFDNDYQCTAGAYGCEGIADIGTDSSVIVSCGPNKAEADNACVYDDDNIVFVYCRN